VHLDGSLALTKLRPRKQRQAQIDGGGVQRIQTLMQIDAHQITGVQRTGGRNQPLREIGEDTPVVRFVRVGQSRARHFAAEPHVIQLAL